MAGDPIARLLPVGILGGFRYKGSRHASRLVVLCTSGTEADWPDELDLTTGTFTYYGDGLDPWDSKGSRPSGRQAGSGGRHRRAGPASGR
jgi:hypothetical protein